MNDAADAHKSKAAGALQVDAVKPKTLADGLQAKMSNLTWVSLSLSLSLPPSCDPLDSLERI